MNNQTVKPELKSPEMKARFLQQIAGTGIMMKCIAKSFQLPDMVLNGVLLNDKQERTLYLTNDKGYSDFYDIDEWIPELTPIDQITDEQAIDCCRFKNEMSFMTTKKWIVERKEHYALITSRYSSHSFSLDFISGDVEFYNDNEIEVTISDTTKDYLRSIGMACPWLGNSVEELIEAGYCQLKGGEKDG